MQREEFEKLVEKGIKAIPEKFLEKLINVDIVIEDDLTPHQAEKLKTNRIILGLYEGVPQTKRGRYAQVLPDKITIFKNSIEKIASSEANIEKIVKDTVWHEIAHHFGMNEYEVKKAEKKKSI